MMQIGPGLFAQRGAGGSAGPTLATLPVTPASRWHPQFSSVTETGGRVTAASDLTGLAGLTEGGAGIGPRVLTDALGRKFWRFEGAEFLNVATTLVIGSTRATSVFLVGRVHRGGATQRFVSAGNVAAGTTLNTGGGMLDSTVTSSGGQYLGAPASVDRWRVMTGAQMQVMGSTRRTTALGGNRAYINRGSAGDGAQSSTVQVNVAGGEIGRYAFSPGTSGTWGQFDLYEMVVCNAGLTDAEGLAVSTALADHWAIPDIAHQLILEGDSITQGTGLVTSGISCAMVLTDPGASLLPATWRVVNRGTSGNQVTDLVIRRDAANGWPQALVPGGQNVVAFEIGRNDFVIGAQSAAQHHASVTAYLNTPTTGILQRGWTVRQMANIAGTAGLNASHVDPYRTLIRGAQYLTDTQTQAGGAFAGRLSIVGTDLIEDGAAGTVFQDGTDAGNTAYYAGDNTHPGVLGARVRVIGGTTPGYGVAAGL